MEMETSTPEKKPQQQQNDAVAVELPAPSGWTKKFTPKRRKNEIVFISPTGEEIKSKRQLEQYLKSHREGPPASEFDWGSGGTPRRSARLSGKSKATESPGTETPEKKQKISSSKRGRKEENDADEEGETADEDEGNADEINESAAVSMEEAEDAEHGKGEVVTGEVLPEKGFTKDTDQKADAEEVVTEEPGLGEGKDPNVKNEEDTMKTNMDQGENLEAGNNPSDGKDEAAKSKTMSSTGSHDLNKEAASAPSECEVPFHLPKPNETPTVQESGAVADSISKVPGPEAEEPTGGKLEVMGQQNEEASGEKAESAEVGAASSDISKRDEAENPKEKNSMMEEASAGNQGTPN